MIANMMYSAAESGAEELYGDPVVQELIHSDEKFDAVTLESYFFQEPASAFLHKFSCVAIEVSTPWRVCLAQRTHWYLIFA